MGRQTPMVLFTPRLVPPVLLEDEVSLVDDVGPAPELPVEVPAMAPVDSGDPAEVAKHYQLLQS